MYKSYRTKLKLNNRERTLMAQHAGYGRWVYNWGLRMWMEAYKEGLKPNANKLRKFFTNYVKPNYPWMSSLSSRVYQYAFRSLGDAFKRFFEGLGDYPRFKKKYHHDSFTLDNGGNESLIKILGHRHKLPFIGWVKTWEELPECEVKKVTISRQAGDWYLSYSFEIPDEPQAPKRFTNVGVDLGINYLATLSTGIVFINPKPLKQVTKKLARLQHDLSRKVYGSSNYKKASLAVAKLHCRVADMRADNLHKMTTYLVKNHDRIVIEDLNVSGMLKNHKLARAISDCGFGEFRRQLDYKCQRYGMASPRLRLSELVIADRFYPSSQICSDCRQHQQKMSLSERIYYCPVCHMRKDRDYNAAINLSRTSGSGGLACGASAADSSR